MMQLRHKITKEYESNPRHIRRWELTIEWLKQFDIKGRCCDCGDKTELTGMIEKEFPLLSIRNTKHDLDREDCGLYYFDNIFAFEVIEHLLNPLVFMNWILSCLDYNGDNTVYISTPINRPKWMRNKKLHFHEFNYNELVHLINVAGFKIVDEKRINCTTWKMITGFRPLLRYFGIDKNILLKLKREK